MNNILKYRRTLTQYDFPLGSFTPINTKTTYLNNQRTSDGAVMVGEFVCMYVCSFAVSEWECVIDVTVVCVWLGDVRVVCVWGMWEWLKWVWVREWVRERVRESKWVCAWVSECECVSEWEWVSVWGREDGKEEKGEEEDEERIQN